MAEALLAVATAVQTAASTLPATPMPTVPLVARYTVTYKVGLTEALTTTWTEPGSCATAVPTMYAGTCNTAGCSAFAVSRLPDLLWTWGLTVNYPGYTTSQELTSTECMPSGYAPLQSMYFTGGTDCPVSWTTATVAADTYYSSKTIVCCPTNYVATSIKGNAKFDCYRNMTVTAGQGIVLAAEGKIATTRPDSIPSTVGFVSSWASRSIISTTTWPTATVADLLHPAVNFLLTGTAAAPATPTANSGNSTSSGSSSSFSLFQLALGPSIGILVGIAIGGLICLCCLAGLIRWMCARGREKPQPQQPQVIYYSAGAPPPGQYGYGK